MMRSWIIWSKKDGPTVLLSRAPNLGGLLMRNDFEVAYTFEARTQFEADQQYSMFRRFMGLE